MSDFALTQAGEIIIDQCILMRGNGEYFNVTQQLDTLTLYEDMYSPFMTGFITLTDTLDMPGVYGRAGMDLLKLKLYTPSIDKSQYIDAYFHIYKMAERVEVKDRMQGYNYYFSSAELLTDMKKRISRSFTGTPSDLAKTILENHLGTDKKILVEPTNNTVSYTSNFWCPSKNLTYLAGNSVNSKLSPTYMFYENRDGLNFKSLESVSETTVIQDFNGSDYTSDTNTTDGATRFGTAKRDPEMDYKTLLKLRIDTTFDFLRDYKDGLINSKMYSHDLTRKKLDIKITDLLKEGMYPMNKNKLYTEFTVKNQEPILMNMSRHTDVFNNGDVTDFKWKQKRVMKMGLYRSSLVEIEVFGRTDYTIGKMVSLNLNRMKQITQNESAASYTDYLYSGNYIITAIAHKITRDSHICNIELAKTHTNAE